MTLDELFPDEDYRFHFRFERGNPRDFFGETNAHGRLMAERKQWIENSPGRCVVVLPECAPLLEETSEFARQWRRLKQEPVPSGDEAKDRTASTSTATQCADLGCHWEPDFLLMKLEMAGQVRLVGGCVCFPSSWSLEEKIGQPIEVVHGVVPGLNSAIGSQIQGFLAKLRPGVAWLRNNWGLTRSAELNQHPARKLPRLDQTVTVKEVWLRLEHQALIALPLSNGVLFGIRLEVRPFSEVCQDRMLAARFSRALQTMPESMAVYKGLADARDKLIQLLQS